MNRRSCKWQKGLFEVRLAAHEQDRPIEDKEEVRNVLADKLTSDAALRKQLGAKGQEQAKMFSWRRTAELTLAGYDEAQARFIDDRGAKRRHGFQHNKNSRHRLTVYF